MSDWQQRSKSVLHDYSHLVEEFRTQVDDWNDRLQELRPTLGADTLKQLRKDFDSVRRRLDADFNLVIAGDFKRGKSTLINALVGSRVASSNVTPETVTINRFRYGSTSQLVATLQNGAKVPLQPEDIALERLEPILEKLGSPVEYLLAEVDVPWLQGVTLVDTPGMGDLLARFDKAVIDYLVQADSVIYVISALSPLSESEERFLRQSLAPHEFPKLMFVINMMDHVNSDEEAARVVERIKARILKLFPQAQIFAVSALDELSRQLGGNRPNAARQAALESSFGELRTHLEESILLNRQRIQLDRACELAGQSLERLQRAGQRLRSALENDAAKLTQSLEQCENGNSELHGRIAREKEEVATFIQGLGQEARGWMLEFCERLERDTLPDLLASKVERVQKFFPFFLSEVTREALTACVRAHQAHIVERVQQCQSVVQKDMAEFAGASQVGESVGRQALWSTPWTGQETFQMVMSFTGIGEILNVVLDKKKQNQQLQQYADRIRDSLPRFRDTLSQQVPQIYNELTSQILQELQQGYELELSQSAAALRQAQELQQRGGADVGALGTRLDELDATYKEASGKLEELQQRLWFSEGLVTA
jgi:predicted GTPase